MTLPQAEWQRRAGMKPLLAALGASDGETRYVGGCVRDTMLKLPVSDVDLATRLQPQEVIDRLQKARIKAVPTGLAHGTVTAVIHGSPVEITTLRRDVATDGRRATIAYTEDWEEDAARRDFTMNALFADPDTHELFDYFGGEEDLARGIVRFIGEPLRRIAEDHLRILRFFRFHARFGTTEPNSEALAACIARANDLMALSRERIADEFMKLLVLERAPATVDLMVASGILRPVLPEIGEESAASLRQLSDRELALGVAADPVRRLAALLPPSPDVVAGVARRLKLSNRTVKRLHCAALRSEPAPQDPLELAYWIGTEEARDRLLLGPAASLRSLKLWICSGRGSVLAFQSEAATSSKWGYGQGRPYRQPFRRSNVNGSLQASRPIRKRSAKWRSARLLSCCATASNRELHRDRAALRRRILVPASIRAPSAPSPALRTRFLRP